LRSHERCFTTADASPRKRLAGFFYARSISHRGIERRAANRSRVIRSIPILDGSIETRFNELIQKNFSPWIRVCHPTIPHHQMIVSSDADRAARHSRARAPRMQESGILQGFFASTKNARRKFARGRIVRGA
jgi:hypothetical protein